MSSDGIIRWIICQVLAKRKGKYADLKDSSAEQSCKIAGEKEGIGAGNINVIQLLVMNTINYIFKAVTHLNLINQQIVGPGFLPSVLNSVIQCITFTQGFFFFQPKSDLLGYK